MSGYYFQTGNKTFLEVALEDTTTDDKPDIVFCVDKSGSMSGGPMNNVNIVLKQIFQVCGVDYPIFCYDYGVSKSKLSNVTDSTPIIASGGTSFKSVFDEMVKYLTDNVKPTTFIFMTDGQDTSVNATALEESIKKLKMACTAMTKTGSVTVHVIGFSSGVNSSFLERVRTLGNTDGLFKYSTISSELQADFMDMFNLASSQKEYKVKFGGTNFKKSAISGVISLLVNSGDIELVDSDESDSEEETPKLVVLTDSKGNKTKIKVKTKTPSSLDKLKVFNLIEPETEEEVKDVIRGLCGIAKSGDFNEKLAIEKMKKDINDRMLDYLDLFTKIKAGQVKEEVKLRLNALKHKATFTNMDAQRKLDMRANKNTEYFQKTDINGILKGYLENDMTQEKWDRIKAISEKWKCCYSFDNLHYMMRKSYDNIMCIGVLVERTEDAIDNPAKGLKLVKLSNTIITYDSFIEHLTQTRQNALVNGEQDYGDFNTINNSYCVVGASREKINAVIPLHLDEEHMKRIRILEGIWLGHMYTLNSFGYDKNQEIGLLKLLWQMIEQYDGSEFQGTIITEFSKVCKFIISESVGFFSAYGKTTFENFINDIDSRSLAVVEDLEIILTIGFLTGEEALYKSLVAVYEEVIRRRCSKMVSSMNKSKQTDLHKLLLYGTKQTVIAVRQGKMMEKDDDPDYVERSYIDYFNDEMNTPIQLIQEKSSLSARKQISSYEPEMVEGIDLSVPEFLTKFIKYVGLKEDWLTGKIDNERIRLNVMVGLTSNVGFGGVKSHSVKKHLDESIQGPVKNSVYYTLTPENVDLVATKACMCKTMEGFGGILRKYCSEKYGLIFDAVIDKLLTVKDDKFVNVNQKIAAIMSNKLHCLPDGNERYGKLYIGEIEKNCWKPTPTQLGKIMNTDVDWSTIGAENIKEGLVNYHEYRESNKPNRHGFGRHNPNPDYLHKFTGY